MSHRRPYPVEVEVTCPSCLEGEHDECSTPALSHTERDTGFTILDACCCWEDTYDGPDMDYEPTTMANRFDVW